MKLGWVRWMTTAAVAAVVAGCGVPEAVDAGADRDEPVLGAVPVVDSYDDLVFPLDAYHLSTDQLITMRRADDVLVRECVRRYGFDYPLPDRTAEPELENRVIGVVDRDLAARYGYKPAGYAEHANRVREAGDEQQPWTSEMVDVLNGDGRSEVNGVAVPEGGCTAVARTALGVHQNGGAGNEELVFALQKRSSTMAEADSRLTAAWDRWSACMAAAGYHYRNPWQANNDPAFGADVATQGELDTAVADTTCRAEHDVNGIWVAVRTAYQEDLVTANADALRDHQTAATTQLQRATNVLSAR